MRPPRPPCTSRWSATCISSRTVSTFDGSLPPRRSAMASLTARNCSASSPYSVTCAHGTLMAFPPGPWCVDSIDQFPGVPALSCAPQAPGRCILAADGLAVVLELPDRYRPRTVRVESVGEPRDMPPAGNRVPPRDRGPQRQSQLPPPRRHRRPAPRRVPGDPRRPRRRAAGMLPVSGPDSPSGPRPRRPRCPRQPAAPGPTATGDVPPGGALTSVKSTGEFIPPAGVVGLPAGGRTRGRCVPVGALFRRVGASLPGSRRHAHGYRPNIAGVRVRRSAGQNSFRALSQWPEGLYLPSRPVAVVRWARVA
jgi:hypothetical protein